MPAAHLAGRRRGDTRGGAGGGGQPRPLVYDTQIVVRASDGALGLAQPCSDPSPYFLRRKRTPGTPSGQCIRSPLKGTQQTSPRRTRIPSWRRSLRAQSVDPMPLLALGPYAPGPIPSEGLPRLRNVSSPTPRLSSAGTPRASSPPPSCVPSCTACCTAHCAFFCASASFPAASTGIFSSCHKKPPPAPPGYRPQSRCAVRSSLTRRPACCCSQWRSIFCGECHPHRWTRHSIGRACTPCLRAARTLNLQKNPFA